MKKWNYPNATSWEWGDLLCSAEFRIACDPFNDYYWDAERGLVGRETLKGQRSAGDRSGWEEIILLRQLGRT